MVRYGQRLKATGAQRGDSSKIITGGLAKGKEEILVGNILKHALPIVRGVSVVTLQSALVIGICSISIEAAHADANVLGLETAVEAAQSNDPWLVENRHSQDAVESLSVAAGTLPDPTVSFGLANFPTDTFAIDQEPMTQVKVGVTQVIPRGDSLQIKRKQLQTLGSQFPYQRLNRRATTVVTVSQLWLDGYTAQESINLIEKDRPLFEQLVDVAEASYSSALGRTRQQDIIRAQLELTRLDDRLTALKQKQEVFLERLSEWLSGYFGDQYQNVSPTMQVDTRVSLELQSILPDIKMLNEYLYLGEKKADPQALYAFFAEHPAVKALERKIEASKLGIDLARQSYKPMWGVSGSYSYRDDPSGGDRADFVSLGLSFDLPVFTKNRQDKELQSAVSQTEAVKTTKWSLIRKMIAEFEKNKAMLDRLTERQQLFRDQLLPQMHEQAEASLTAYTNDDGDFAEVVRARIAELNAQIDALEIDVEKQKTIIKLNYFFMKSAEDIIATQ